MRIQPHIFIYKYLVSLLRSASQLSLTSGFEPRHSNPLQPKSVEGIKGGCYLSPLKLPRACLSWMGSEMLPPSNFPLFSSFVRYSLFGAREQTWHSLNGIASRWLLNITAPLVQLCSRQTISFVPTGTGLYVLRKTGKLAGVSPAG